MAVMLEEAIGNTHSRLAGGSQPWSATKPLEPTLAALIRQRAAPERSAIGHAVSNSKGSVP